MLNTDKADLVTISIDGRECAVPAGVSVAAAILGHTGERCFCSSRPERPDQSEPRGPFCLMGVCFDCLAEIDGEPDRQTCLITVREGMAVRRPIRNQQSARSGQGNGHA